MHSPENAEEVAEARRLGGLRRRREVAVSGAYEFDGLETVAGLRRLLVIPPWTPWVWKTPLPEPAPWSTW